MHGTHHLFDQQTFYVGIGLSAGPMHYSQDLQISLFSNFFIKNWSHGTIHTFKRTLRVYLDTVYFAETKNLLLKILQIKVKVS